MKAYIAAPYSRRPDADFLRGYLEAAGITITSSWLFLEPLENDVWARRDLADVDAADTLIMWNPLEWLLLGGGGRHVEMGYAIAKFKRLVLLGERSHIFHHLSDVIVVPYDDTRRMESFAKLVEVLKS